MNQAIAQMHTLTSTTTFSALSVMSDFLIVLILFGAMFLFVWYVGRGPFVALQLSFYAAYAIYVAFPFISFIPTAPPLTALAAHIGLYGAFTLGFYMILRRVVVSDFLYIGLFGVIALSFLAAGFLLALGYHVFAVTSIYSFTPAVDKLFLPAQYFFWWFIAPAVGLFFLAR